MSIHWAKSPSVLNLKDDEVYVWCIPVGVSTSQMECLRSVLSPDEIVRADRFVFEKDRARYIVVRGTLRTILGQILDHPPARLCFSTNAYGKPALTGEANDVEFNVSHAHDLALIGATRGRSIGVDIEYTGRKVDDTQLAQRFFSLQEQAELLALPANLRRKAFFDCWTRKEGYIKARGQGLSIPLDRFAVSLQPDQPAALLSSVDDDIKQWLLVDLNVHPEYSAALAVKGRNLAINCFTWELE